MVTDIQVALIAVAGTLFGVITSAIGTYIIQSNYYNRQKKTDKESEERKIKRDLVAKRLDIVEEVVTLRMFLTGLTIKEMYGDPIYSDKETIQNKRHKLDDISSQAWTAVLASGSKELKEHFQEIGKAFQESEETGNVTNKNWNDAHDSYVKITNLIDNMKVSV